MSQNPLYIISVVTLIEVALSRPPGRYVVLLMGCTLKAEGAVRGRTRDPPTLKNGRGV